MQYATQASFLRWVRDALPGDRFVYYTGEGLMRDRQYNVALDRLANRVAKCREVVLFQVPKEGSRVDIHYVARKKSGISRTKKDLMVSGRPAPMGLVGRFH